MRKKNFTAVLTAGVCVLLFVFSASSRDLGEENDIENKLKIPPPGYVQTLYLNDGSSIIGRIVEIGESGIKFKTDMGILTVAITQVKSIKEYPQSSIKKGKYWFPNPNTTRLYFAPTGRMLEKGEGFFSDIYLFFPGVSYGVTDNFTIGAGASIFPGVSIGDQLFYLTPKIGLKTSGKYSFALGALLVTTPGFFDEESQLVGVVYGVGTVGTHDSSFSAGLGYGFAAGEWARKPMVMLGGEIRLSRRISFVTENWVFPGIDQPIISYGIRFLGKKLSIDLALYNTIGEDMLFPGFPYVDFVFNF